MQLSIIGLGGNDTLGQTTTEIIMLVGLTPNILKELEKYDR